MGSRESISTAARLAGTSQWKVRRWIEEGKLSAEDVVVNGRTLVRLVEVEEVRRLVRTIRTGRPPAEGRG